MALKDVPKGLRRQVAETFVAALQSDPALANGRGVKTWIVWEGEDKAQEPTVDMAPVCMVQVLSGPVRRLCSTRLPGRPMSHVDESRPTVVITILTKGTDAGDGSDLADAIDRALSPSDPQRRAALQERFRRAGIKLWQRTREIAPSSNESFSLEGTAHQGSYELLVHSFA